MVANRIQHTVAIDREASFADQAAKNWDSLTANGYVIFVHDLDYDGVVQAVIPNKNLRIRAAHPQEPIQALRNVSFPFAWYWISSSAHAAEASQAARAAQDELLSNALGGEQLGYRAGVAGGTAAVPTVDGPHGNNLTPYSFGFFYDESAAVGFFRQWVSITDGGGSPDTVNLSPGHTLPFTPDGGGADTMYAVVEHYPDWDALEDHTHASHRTHTMFFKRRQADDNVEVKGVKLGLELSPIEQGTAVELKFVAEADTFTHENITQPALTQTPNGAPGLVVGSGVATVCVWAAADALLATQTFWGGINVTVGIKPEGVAGPGGSEGRHGYGVTEDSYDATMVEITVPFLDDYAAEFRAGTNRHLLIQIGNQPDTARYIYFPNLAYAEEPKRVSVGGRAGSQIKFLVLERDVAQGALTAAQYHRARAKFNMGRVG